jgi:hypothetical protein
LNSSKSDSQFRDRIEGANFLVDSLQSSHETRVPHTNLIA